MAIQPKCKMCGQELSDFGPILLSPLESSDGGDMVRKFHICKLY